MTRILFFKAQKPGLDAVMGDLFDTPSTVSGHMRGSTYVAPYQSTRKKKREEPEPVQLSYRDMNPVNRGQEYRAHYAGAVAKIRKVNTAYVASIYTGTNNSFNGLYSESAPTLKEAKAKIGQAMARLVADGTLTPGAREPHQVVTQPETTQSEPAKPASQSKQRSASKPASTKPTMGNFSYWLEHIADMPEKKDGQWVDLETGLPYNHNVDYATGEKRSSRRPLSDKAQDARAVAKQYGGRALKGTAKQKEWAEKIRAEKVTQMTDDQAEMACDPKGLLTNSKFWIEQRERSGAEIGAFVQEQQALLKQARSLREAGKGDEYAAVAAKYNALTTAWGWT